MKHETFDCTCGQRHLRKEDWATIREQALRETKNEIRILVKCVLCGTEFRARLLAVVRP
jgi:hypothetical protein